MLGVRVRPHATGRVSSAEGQRRPVLHAGLRPPSGRLPGLLHRAGQRRPGAAGDLPGRRGRAERLRHMGPSRHAGELPAAEAAAGRLPAERPTTGMTSRRRRGTSRCVTRPPTTCRTSAGWPTAHALGRPAGVARLRRGNNRPVRVRDRPVRDQRDLHEPIGASPRGGRHPGRWRRRIPAVRQEAGLKFHDHNANGVRDGGDERIAGWPISLYKDDGDKVLEDGDDGLVDGQFTTARRRPHRRQWRVPVHQAHERQLHRLRGGRSRQCGLEQSLPTPTLPTRRTAAGPGWGRIGYVLPDGRVVHVGNDFGNYQNATKSGTKFDDLNGDGDRDAGEPGIGGRGDPPRRHRRAGNAVHLHTNTAANGTTRSSAPPAATRCARRAGRLDPVVPDGHHAGRRLARAAHRPGWA